MQAVCKKRVTAIVLLAIAPIVQTLAIAILNSLLVSFLAYTLMVCVGTTVLVAILLWGKPDTSSRAAMLGVSTVKKDQLVLGLLIGFAIDAIMVLGFWLFYKVFSDAEAVRAVAGRLGIRGGIYLWIAVSGLVVNAVAEEFFWRGCPHALLGLVPDGNGKKLFGPLQHGALARVLIVSLFFGMNHVGIMLTIAPSLPAALLSLLGIFLSGAFWSLLRESTKSLIPSLVSHVLVTLGYSGLLVFYFSIA